MGALFWVNQGKDVQRCLFAAVACFLCCVFLLINVGCAAMLRRAAVRDHDDYYAEIIHKSVNG